MKKISFKKKINLVIILSLSVLGIIFYLRNNHPLEKIIIPPANFFASLGDWGRDRIEFFSSIGKMKKQDILLREENLKLKSQLAKLKDVKNENDKLRSELDLVPKEKYTLRAALIVGRDLSGRSKIFVINQGAKSGIKKGMAVIIGEGILVGKVLTVNPNSSSIQLLFDQNSKINAEIVESGLKGIVVGKFGTSAEMEMLPQIKEIKKGDTIITSGVGNIFPRGLLVGYIKEVAPSSDQLFQQATITFPGKLNDLRMVWVILSS